MSHYAKVFNNIVEQVIVAETDYFDTFVDSSPGEWIQTSYNTRGGVHSTGGMPLRMNYAKIGATYDKEKDAFYAPQPFPSWSLNENTFLWTAPTDIPTDGNEYKWNETSKEWVVQ